MRSLLQKNQSRLYFHLTYASNITFHAPTIFGYIFELLKQILPNVYIVGLGRFRILLPRCNVQEMKQNGQIVLTTRMVDALAGKELELSVQIVSLNKYCSLFNEEW